MRKLLSLASCGLVAATAMAAPLTPAQISKLQMVENPEMTQKVRAQMASTLYQLECGQTPDNAYTRSYTDPKGTRWIFIANLIQDGGAWEYYSKLDENGKTLIGPDGKEVPCEKEDLPLYLAQLTVIAYPQGANANYASFLAGWPSYYYGDMGNQGTEEDPNMTPIPFDEFVNEPNHQRKFTESDKTFIPKYDKATGTYTTYHMVSSAMRMQALWNGQSATTYVTSTSASNLTFSSYIDETKETELKINVYLKDANNQTRPMVANYAGTAKIGGWSTSYLSGNLDNIHLFNAGQISSESLGMTNPFTGDDFGPLTCLYLVASDKAIDINIDPTKGGFDESKTFKLQINKDNVPAGDNYEDHLTYVMGYLFAPANFEGPQKGVTYKMLLPVDTYDPDFKQWYSAISPEENSMVPSSYADDWTSYGMMCYFKNYSENLKAGQSYISFNTANGLYLDAKLGTGDVLRLSGKGDIIYHNNENDMTQTVKVPAVGDFVTDYVAPVKNDLAYVAGVVAPNTAISVANGAICVNADANVAVAIYKLDGQKVAAKALKAGESYTVAPGKGLYIVKAGNVAKKVAL